MPPGLAARPHADQHLDRAVVATLERFELGGPERQSEQDSPGPRTVAGVRFVVRLAKGRLGSAIPGFWCGELGVLSFEVLGLVTASFMSSAGEGPVPMGDAGARGSVSGTASSVDAMIYVEEFSTRNESRFADSRHGGRAAT